MKRIQIKLGDLKPNPWKKDINGGRISPAIVAQIKESASKTSFWEQWVVREHKGEYELAFGHHRLVAAIELFGTGHVVSVQVEDYSDEQMFIALADENAGDETSLQEQCDTVRVAREYLKAHPEGCKCHPVHRAQGGGKPHVHGSETCIETFLGKENWNHKKIVNLLTLIDKADSSVLKATVIGREHPNGGGSIGQQAAVALTQLPKETQKAVVNILTTVPGLTTSDVKSVVAKAKTVPQSKQHQTAIKAASTVALPRAVRAVPVKKVEQTDFERRMAKQSMTHVIEVFFQLLPFDAAHTAYKMAAQVLHPDKGGDKEKMSELTFLWGRIKREHYGKAAAA